MIFKKVINKANIMSDDDIDLYTALNYINLCVSDLNLECGMKLPEVDNTNFNEEYVITDAPYVDNIVADLFSTYICYYAKKTEGYMNNENTFFSEYVAKRITFRNKYKHLIKQEYLLDDEEDGSKGTIYGNWKIRTSGGRLF